ncbi:MAG: polysaccharide biosynthesis C-terminal domain-containing protein, partial [Chloroflexota bacterium]
DRLEVYLGSSLVIGTSITLLFTVILAIIVYFIGYSAEITQFIFLALAIAVLPQVEGFLFEAAIIGIERMEWVVMVRFPLTILRVGASLVLLELGFGIRILFILLGIYHALIVLAYYIVLKRSIPGFKLRPEWTKVRFLFFLTLPFAITTGFTEIFGQVDKIILSRFQNLQYVGIYATGILLIQLIVMLAPAVMDSLFPSLSRVFIQSQARFDQLIVLLSKALALIFFPITILVIGFAEFIILFGFGNEYVDSVLVLQIASLIIVPSYVSRLWYRATLASGNEHKGIAVAIVGGIAQVGLNFLLIPRFGFLGATYAWCGTVLVRTIHNLYNANSIVQISLGRTILKILGCIGVGGGAFWVFFMRDQTFLAIGLSLFIFYAALFVSKTIEMDDFNNLELLQKRKSQS